MNTLKKKSPRWRLEQNKKAINKKKSQVVLGIFFIGLIGLMMLVNLLWRQASLSIWDGVNSLAMASVDNDNISLVVLLPSQEKTVSFLIPFNMIGEVPFGFGEYQMGSIYQLGKLENEGGRLLMRTLQDNLGVFVSGYQVNRNSNLSWWDKARVFWFKNMVASEKKMIDLVEEQVVDESFLADGTKVYRLKALLSDELVNREIFDEKLVADELEIGVINASDGLGVAQNFSRLIGNLGGDVTLVSSALAVNNSMIQVKREEDKKSYTVKVLADFLGIENIVLMEESLYRADIVLVVGQDYLSLK